MKLLAVLGSNKTYDTLSRFFKPLGFEIIRYRNVQKAMDNIEEIDPVGIIISARDFPRHWKTFTGFVRYDRSKNDCSVILLKGETFPEEEINKAMSLEVNGLVLESLETSAEAEKIQTLLARQTPTEQKDRLPPETLNRFGFVFSRPEDESLVTGTVKTISSTGLSFEPEHPAMTNNLASDTEIRYCTLRAGEAFLSPSCTVFSTGQVILLEFRSFPQGEQEQLDKYLENP